MDKVKVIKEYCPQNHRCPLLRVCPVNAIAQNGYEAPTVDQEKCIGCGRCVQFCAYRAFRLG